MRDHLWGLRGGVGRIKRNGWVVMDFELVWDGCARNWIDSIFWYFNNQLII